jgi:hypothetical protein
MNTATAPVPIKRLLREFVSWLEFAYGDAERGAASEFAKDPPSEALAMAEVVMDAALKLKRPVLFATDAPVKSVIGSLVLRRAGVKLADVYQGDFSDAQFEALTENIVAVKTSILLIESQSGGPR